MTPFRIQASANFIYIIILMTLACNYQLGTPPQSTFYSFNERVHLQFWRLLPSGVTAGGDEAVISSESLRQSWENENFFLLCRGMCCTTQYIMRLFLINVRNVLILIIYTNIREIPAARISQ